MVSEIELIHDLEEDGDGLEGNMVLIALYAFLIRRGWLSRMPAKYHEVAQNLILSGILDDIQSERIAMTPKIEITTKDGTVISIRSKGSEMDVEMIEEDTGKKVLFTTLSEDSGHLLFPSMLPVICSEVEDLN